MRDYIRSLSPEWRLSAQPGRPDAYWRRTGFHPERTFGLAFCLVLTTTSRGISADRETATRFQVSSSICGHPKQFERAEDSFAAPVSLRGMAAR